MVRDAGIGDTVSMETKPIDHDAEIDRLLREAKECVAELQQLVKDLREDIATL